MKKQSPRLESRSKTVSIMYSLAIRIEPRPDVTDPGIETNNKVCDDVDGARITSLVSLAHVVGWPHT